MAKKVRFPLEMENSVEVRSMEELRANFSLARVLGYVSDGRLITWLQDRYENVIAEAVAEVDPNSEDAARKICEIFDVKYDENAEEEIEKAEERKRKLELLKEHPECMDYAKSIDFVAFDQDDLYDLLDENVEEIYLCGKRFSIPTAKGNTRYVGIIECVEVVIDAKQAVDFESQGIRFENCKFDDKYSQLVSQEDDDSSKEIETIEESNCSASDEIDKDEVAEFIENIKEAIEEFANDEFENEDDDLYEYDDSIECDADDYNDSGYSTKAKAKAACKAELTKAIAEVKGVYEDAKKELIVATETYYRGLTISMTAFLESVFYESCDTLADVYCTGATKDYVLQKTCELKARVESQEENWGREIQKKCKNSFDALVKESFDKAEKVNVPNLKELFDACEYEEEDEDDYSFNMDDACESLVGIYSGIIEDAEGNFPDRVYDAYIDIINEYLNKLFAWVDSL